MKRTKAKRGGTRWLRCPAKEPQWSIGAVVYDRPRWWQFSKRMEHSSRIRELLFECDTTNLGVAEMKTVRTKTETVILIKWAL